MMIICDHAAPYNITRSHLIHCDIKIVIIAA